MLFKDQKKTRILFFIAGDVPTGKEVEEAKRIGTKMFRNARVAESCGPIERCDFVAGLIPRSYSWIPIAKNTIEEQCANAASKPVEEPSISSPISASEKCEFVHEIARSEVQKPECEQPVEMSIEEMKRRLDEAGVKYRSNATEATLARLCSENGIV